MKKFVKEIINKLKYGSPMEQLSIISSLFTIFGISFFTALSGYVMTPQKIDMLGAFFVKLGLNLFFITVLIIICVMLLKLKNFLIKKLEITCTWFKFVSLFLIVTVCCIYIGILLLFGPDVTSIFRQNPPSQQYQQPSNSLH